MRPVNGCGLMARVSLFYYGPDFYTDRRTEIITLRGPIQVTESNSFQAPSMTIDVFSGCRDFEGDRCRLARFNMQLARPDLSWYPEHLSIKGFLSELTACPYPQKSMYDHGWAYMPEPDRTFRPGLVEILIEN